MHSEFGITVKCIRKYKIDVTFFLSRIKTRENDVHDEQASVRMAAINASVAHDCN